MFFSGISILILLEYSIFLISSYILEPSRKMQILIYPLMELIGK